MRATTLAVLAALTLSATFAGAQQTTTPAPNQGIIYAPVDCIRAGSPAILHLNVTEKGKLIVYFRKVNASDLCSLDGENRGPNSTAMLPEFAAGDEIEYFFVVVDGKRVVAKSTDVYRVKVTEQCQTAWARHVDFMTMMCGRDGRNAMGSSIRAGYALNESATVEASPFRP